jgi:hypothetical protein
MKAATTACVIVRRQIFHRLFTFVRTCKVRYHPLIVDKRHVTNARTLSDMLTKQLTEFLLAHLSYFHSFDKVILYYDFGQPELARILVTVFGKVLNRVEFRKVVPADYRLFQAADMLCTLELLALKAENKMLSRSETAFFSSPQDLKKIYIKPIRQKRF